LETNRRLQKQVRRARRGIAGWGVFEGLEKDLKDMGVGLMLAADLRTPAMRDRHWRALYSLCKKRGRPPAFPRVPLALVLDLKLHDFSEGIKGLIDAAAKEFKVRARYRCFFFSD